MIGLVGKAALWASVYAVEGVVLVSEVLEAVKARKETNAG